jgi:hypothetical protein
MSYQSNLPQIKERFRAATSAGLLAAAAVVENKVKEDLRGGFTTGMFVTGASVAAVTHSEPEVGPDGAFVLVGTSLMYNLYWELGFRSIFSRKFERKEVWIPALFSTRDAQLAAFERVYQRMLGGGAGGFGQRAASPRSPGSL